jgi:hypothetical protein
MKKRSVIGLDSKTFEDLNKISQQNHRSKIDQIRKWVSEELQEQELDKYTKAVSSNKKLKDMTNE